jgi:hypothetical protein
MEKITNKDEVVQKLISIVQEKKAEIEKINKPTWETNCVFIIDGKTSNIRTISNVDKAVELFSYVVSANKIHNEASQMLNVESTFRFSGFTMEQWLNDFKNVTGMLTLNKMKAELAEDEARLDKLVSKEKREELELLALMSKYETK